MLLQNLPRKSQEYLVEFDPSIRIDEMWIDAQTLQLFKHGREEITLSANVAVPLAKKARPASLAFCHHCKMSKPLQQMAQCRYYGGPGMPEKVTEGGVVAYNVEAYNEPAIELCMQARFNMKRAPIQPERCERHFCHTCLMYQYGIDRQACSRNDFFCPFCKGVCVCTRCSRQDQITKMRCHMFALGGDLTHLCDSESPLDRYIGQNWVRVEGLMHRAEEAPRALPEPEPEVGIEA